MLARFFGYGAAANLLIALFCGIMLYHDRSNEALLYLLAGFGLGWWGTFLLGCFLFRLGDLRKTRNGLLHSGGVLLWVLCGAAFVFAASGNSNAPMVLLTFGGGSFVVSILGYCIGASLESLCAMLSGMLSGRGKAAGETAGDGGK